MAGVAERTVETLCDLDDSRNGDHQKGLATAKSPCPEGLAPPCLLRHELKERVAPELAIGARERQRSQGEPDRHARRKRQIGEGRYEREQYHRAQSRPGSGQCREHQARVSRQNVAGADAMPATKKLCAAGSREDEPELLRPDGGEGAGQPANHARDKGDARPSRIAPPTMMPVPTEGENMSEPRDERNKVVQSAMVRASISHQV